MCLFLEAPVAFINEDVVPDLTLMNYPLTFIGMSFGDQVWMEIIGQNISSCGSLTKSNIFGCCQFIESGKVTVSEHGKKKRIRDKYIDTKA